MLGRKLMSYRSEYILLSCYRFSLLLGVGGGVCPVELSELELLTDFRLAFFFLFPMTPSARCCTESGDNWSLCLCLPESSTVGKGSWRNLKGLGSLVSL